MKTKADIIMQTMNILFWIIFIGLCIKTGALLVSFFSSLFSSPESASDLFIGYDLLTIYGLDTYQYVLIASFILILTGLKAYIAYLVIKISIKFDLKNPFSLRTANLIQKISKIAVFTGLLAMIASRYCDWLFKRFEIAERIDLGGSETLFFAGILFIIGQVFKRGVELQSENELTI